MTTKVTILSVKCIAPSSGASPVVTDLIDSASKTFANAANNVFYLSVTVPGAVIVGATSATSGYGIGEFTLKRIDAPLDGTDQLYIKVNGDKVFPNDQGHVSISYLQEVAVNYTFDVTDSAKIELFDFDIMSADDPLGTVTVGARVEPNEYTAVLMSKEENSYYELRFRVAANSKNRGTSW